MREALADELEARPEVQAAAPTFLLPGTAIHAESQARAARITVHGVDERFAQLFGDFGEELDLSARGPDQLFPSLALNESLARELGAEPGDDLLVSVELPSAIPGETLLGEKEAEDRLATRRFTLARVLPDRGPGRFGLAPHQMEPRNVFVALAELQEDLERQGRVNALLVDLAPGADGGGQVLDGAVRDLVRLEDLGLGVRRAPGGEVLLESEEYFLKAQVVEAAEKLGAEQGAPARRVLTYLATGLRANGRLVPYSLASAIGPGAPASLTLLDGSPAPAPGEDEVLLDRWAAEDLAVSPSDPVELAYLVMAPGGGLATERVTLRLAGVVEMAGLGVDPTLTPEFPGLENAEDISAWDPPFPVDLGVVRPKDEQFWDEYRATPKAFIAEATGRRLWSTRFGEVTSVRFTVADDAAATRLEAALARELPRRVPLEPFGLAARPVKRQGLEAASGATDFAGLFLAFSFFLIGAAAMLAGLLFSLAVERRVGELGLMLALGYPLRKVRRRLVAEALALAAIGALVGLAGAVGYAALLVAGLNTWWRPAVGTSSLALHVEPASLAIGWVATVLVVAAALWWTVRRLARMPAPALLAGETRPVASRASGRLARWVAAGSGAAAVGLTLAGLLSGETASPGLAFGTGAAALAAGLAALAVRLRGGRSRRPVASLVGVAARNGAANPGRSLLAVALVAAACFVLVTVAANRVEGEAEARVDEGAGGYELLADSAVPLLSELGRDLADPERRAELGLPDWLAGARALSFRVVPGEDASCLNLYRPTEPRLLGVPSEMAQMGESGGFRFAKTVDGAGEGEGWQLLERDLGEGVVPAIADANSAQWILHLPLGQDLMMEDELGRPLRLRLVGTLQRSLFQGELLISEAALLRHFPSRAGWSSFLVDVPPERVEEAATALEEALGRYGFDAVGTAERLAAYAAVEETYLSTFQTLGGLGLLLGTLGLGVALVRSVAERRGELATLRAFGFRRRRLAWMVTAENAVLLLLGVALGTAAGLLAVAPRLAASAGRLPWGSLAGTLAAVVAVGLLACAAAVRAALAAPLLPALKEER